MGPSRFFIDLKKSNNHPIDHNNRVDNLVFNQVFSL
jgi:hypothetical protein